MSIANRALPHGYRWLCVADPTGVFLGAIFRAIDIPTEGDDENGWPDGITWQHIRNLSRITYHNGSIQPCPPGAGI